MSWFKVDDKLPLHRKARAVRKSHATKRRDVAPFGIWVLAGALSDDGFVALELIEDWDDDAEALAERLVAAGMWHKSTRDGEPGYVFHDWHDQNPARGDNDPSSSGTFGNHIRWHVQRSVVDPECFHCPSEPPADEDVDHHDYRGDDRGDSGAMIGPTRDESGANRSRPDPTRPDQSRASDESPPKGRKKPSTTIPDDWQPTDSHRAYAKEHGLDLREQAFRFRNNAIAKDHRYVSWNAAFNTWLSKAVGFGEGGRRQESSATGEAAIWRQAGLGGTP